MEDWTGSDDLGMCLAFDLLLLKDCSTIKKKKTNTLKKHTISFVFYLSFHISRFLQSHDERNIIKKLDKHDFVLIVCYRDHVWLG